MWSLFVFVTLQLNAGLGFASLANGPSARAWASTFLQQRAAEESGRGSVNNLQDDLAEIARHAVALQAARDRLWLDCKLSQEAMDSELEGLWQDIAHSRAELGNNVAAQLAAKSEVKNHAQIIETLMVTIRETRERCTSQADGVTVQHTALQNDLETVRELKAEGPDCPQTLELLHNGSSVIRFSGSSKARSAMLVSSIARLALTEDVTPLQHLQPTRSPRLGLLHKTQQTFQVLDSTAAHDVPVATEVVCQEWALRLKKAQARLYEQQGAVNLAMETQRRQCKAQEKDLQGQLANSRRAQDSASQDLSSAMGGAAHLQRQGQALEQRRAIVQSRLDAKKQACQHEEAQVEVDLHDVIEVRKSLFSKSSPGQTFPMDCKVSEWTVQACSRTCNSDITNPAMTTATRTATLRNTAGGLECPPLEMVLPCELEACEEDCLVSDWGEWSACSAHCAGGTRSRTRTIDSNGATSSCGAGMALDQHEACNIHSCDTDCELSEWTAWSTCTRQCRFTEEGPVGQQRRQRDVTNAASGAGSCPEPSSELRLQVQDCNDIACPANLTCASEQDLVIVLDGSSKANETAQRKLVDEIAEALPSNVRLGIAAYGAMARVMSPILANRKDVLDFVLKSEMPGGDVDAVQGLVMARNMLRASSNPAEQRQQRVLLIMGDQPTRRAATASVAEKLMDAGIGLTVVFVRASEDEQQEACSILQDSCKDNLELVADWESLSAASHQLLAAVCN
mmetsp:Transcript_74006/g.176140  ORF Transcript_74006/g.176140 Transcript_74006/m.176140 type:complete len:738 (+) Transcript_74006:75-2288(+)